MILPSILSYNILDIKDKIKEIKKAGINILHIDIMDGKFVSNITFGHKIIQDIKSEFNIICDAHLMVKDPMVQVGKFIRAGADIITVHYEATDNIKGMINKIKDAGVNVGLAISPDTDVINIKPYLEYVDIVLVMSVYPGKGGQKFILEVLNKIDELNLIRADRNLKYKIEVDGGIKLSNIKTIQNHGVDMMVVGSALLENDDIYNNIKKFKNVIENKKRN